MVAITYARSRLWLGISGVGSIVVLSIALVVSGLPLRMLPSDPTWSGADVRGLLLMMGVLVAVMLPLDLLGGFLLPRWFGRDRYSGVGTYSVPNTITMGAFAKSWLRGVTVQGSFFLLASLLILTMGRTFGLGGATAAVFAIGCFHVTFQLPIARLTASLPSRDLNDVDGKSVLASAVAQVSHWGWRPCSVVVLDHDDTGFTGGVVGLPGRERIVVPAASLARLTPQQLAITIARRSAAVQSGGRTRGMMLAFVWVTVGFLLSAKLPGAGVTSVGELAMTCSGFTLWTFFGLLTLPTLSRQASYAIDGRVVDHGVSPQTLNKTIATLDRLQDDEPSRSALIETIFHPVPSVDNRRVESGRTFPVAWHAARMTLFVSWACMGMLVRAVHCNVGRPELWVMLPTD